MFVSRFLLFFGFWVNCVVTFATEVCFFNTGQGNCIVVKHVDRLVFIDCGGGAPIESYRQAFTNPIRSERKKLKNLARDISECYFLITHNHHDHTNLVETIKETIKKTTVEIYNPTHPKKINGADRVADFIKQTTSIFSDDVELIPIRPDVWTNNRAQNPEHDYNVMFKLKAFGRNVLFMGDVSPQLFTKMYNDIRYLYELRDIDFLVGSHHGSNRSGEISLIGSINPMAVIFCSNPDYEDHLPWDDALDLSFLHSHGQTVVHHQVRSATRDEFLVSPIFTTCCASGFYSLSIEKNSRLTLSDGPGNMPLLTSELSELRLKNRIEQEMMQFRALREKCCKKDLVAISLLTTQRVSFCSKFTTIDQGLFYELSLLKYAGIPHFKDILLTVIETTTGRLDYSGMKDSLSLYINLLLESIPDDSLDEVMEPISLNLLKVLENSQFLYDDLIGLFDNIRLNPKALGIFTELWKNLVEQNTIDVVLGQLDKKIHQKALCCYTKILESVIDCILEQENIPAYVEMTTNGLIQTISNAIVDTVKPLFDFNFHC